MSSYKPDTLYQVADEKYLMEKEGEVKVEDSDEGIPLHGSGEELWSESPVFNPDTQKVYHPYTQYSGDSKQFPLKNVYDMLFGNLDAVDYFFNFNSFKYMDKTPKEILSFTKRLTLMKIFKRVSQTFSKYGPFKPQDFTIASNGSPSRVEPFESTGSSSSNYMQYYGFYRAVRTMNISGSPTKLKVENHTPKTHPAFTCYAGMKISLGNTTIIDFNALNFFNLSGLTENGLIMNGMNVRIGIVLSVGGKILCGYVFDHDFAYPSMIAPEFPPHISLNGTCDSQLNFNNSIGGKVGIKDVNTDKNEGFVKGMKKVLSDFPNHPPLLKTPYIETVSGGSGKLENGVSVRPNSWDNRTIMNTNKFTCDFDVKRMDGNTPPINGEIVAHIYISACNAM